jgi:hypothetical protein
MTEPPHGVPADASPRRGPLLAGGIVFAIGMLSPLAIPLIGASGLPVGWKTGLSGLLLVGIPELFTLVAVGIMGRSGFSWLKGRLFALIKRHGPPERVSQNRYRVGLVLFSTPLLFGWACPYLEHFAPALVRHEVALAVAGDLLLVTSLFVLGGGFWDKLRGLFLWRATVRSTDPTTPSRREAQ